MPLENWKTIFETGGVILLGLTFLFGAGALITSRKLNELQAQQLREFDKDLTTAKMDLAKQQERAAHADERAAALEREVIRLGPRPPLLWGKDRSRVIEKLKAFSGQKVEVRYCRQGANDESITLAMGLAILLKQSDWSVNPLMIDVSSGTPSVVVTVNPKATDATWRAASTFVSSLSELGLMNEGSTALRTESARTAQPPQFEQVGNEQRELTFGPLETERIVVLVFPHP